MDLEIRLRKGQLVREHYRDFIDFAHDAMEVLGFSLSEMQEDISEYIAYGPDRRVVMAQRGEAKSTIAVIYALWCLIQDFNANVLIVTDGDRQAKENSKLLITLIMRWDLLDYMRPSPSDGDRTSVEAFDINHELRSLHTVGDKSPSVSCMTIFGQLTGARATILIADDIETAKRARSKGDREAIYDLSKEFTSICKTGNILILGTPHTRESLYTRLPSRGYDVRVWTGRIPSKVQEERLSGRLAPYIRKLISRWGEDCRTGYGVSKNRGRATDPQLRGEDDLITQELDHGPEGFELQYMLDPTLSDENRQPLKVSDLIFADYTGEVHPEFWVWRADRSNLMDMPVGFPLDNVATYRGIVPEGTEWVKPDSGSLVMTLDPAGGGKDELAWAIGFTTGPYIHLLHVGGLLGGLTDENGEHLVNIIREYNVPHVEVESNMGHGLFEANFRAVLERHKLSEVTVEGKYVSGQKEVRIINSMVTTLQRHRFIVHPSAVESDMYYSRMRGKDGRERSLFYQIDHITTDRGSLTYDDRIDCTSALFRRFAAVLIQDEAKASEKRAQAEWREWMANPMGTPTPTKRNRTKGTRAALQRRRKGR